MKNRRIKFMDKNYDIPCDKAFDSTLALLMEGYEFIPNRCRNYLTDIFQTRLLCQDVICMSGAEAARIFYDNKRFKRKGAAPKRIQKTLFGMGGVQGMDGTSHRDRKMMFMSIMTPQNLERLSKLTEAHWQITTSKWKNNKLVLFDETQKILCKAACQWSGVPLVDTEVCLRAGDMGKMVDAFGAAGIRYCEGKCARNRTEKWARDIIMSVRTHRITPADYTALYIIAWYRDREGKLLTTQTAAVELINIIRPIVAIATYVIFGALAMYEHPSIRKRLKNGEENYITMFVQEIRRYYPFAPFVGARVRNDFIWNQAHARCYFKKGTLVLFDIYGTNHDPRLWKNPNTFNPERFRDWKDNPYTFVPQGGGEVNSGHRCAGEGVTIEVMKVSLSFLVMYLDYKVPKQNLKFCLRRMPTLPKSRFVIKKVRRIN
jgi:fatty-acid peroxygenase